MGLTKNDIEMLRAEIPAQYRAGEGNASVGRLLRQDFVRADDGGDSDLGMDNPHADKNDIAATVAQPNRDIVAERMETERQIQREIMNGDGSVTSIAVQAQKDSGLTARAEAEKRREKGGIDITTQLILLNQQIAELDLLIDDLQDQIAKLDANIDALQQALDSGDFGGEAAQKAIDDYNKAHPDNPVDPNDPDAARNAVQWAQRKDQDRRDDLQTRLDDTRAKRANVVRNRDDLEAEIADKKAAAAHGREALDAETKSDEAEFRTERIEAIRAGSDRVIQESYDRAQGFDATATEKLSALRDQQGARLSAESNLKALDTPSNIDIAAGPDLNSLDISAPPALDGNARTTSVADGMDGENAGGPEIKAEFTKVSGLSRATMPQLDDKMDLNQAGGPNLGGPSGAGLG